MSLIDALDARRELDVYLDECTAKTPGEGPSLVELAGKTQLYPSYIPLVSCLECEHAERVDEQPNTWRCKKGHPFGGFGKVRCWDYKRLETSKAVPRFCGSCKHCRPSARDEGVECVRNGDGEFLPIVRWSIACDSFEEAES